MNIHGPTELNTSYKQCLFTVRIEGVSKAEPLQEDVELSVHEVNLRRLQTCKIQQHNRIYVATGLGCQTKASQI